MTVIAGISNFELSLELLNWRHRIDANIVDVRRTSTSLNAEFANYLMHRNPRRHLAALETAIAGFFQNYQSYMLWWQALIGEGRIDLSFRNQTPAVAVGSLSSWRQIVAGVDPDALVALQAVRRAPADHSTVGIISQLSRWGAHPEIIDAGVQSIFARNLTDTHIHFEASDPIPVFWTRLMIGDVRLDAVRRYSGDELARISWNAERYEQRIWERKCIDEAIKFRREGLLSLSVDLIDRTATPAEQVLQERLFLLRAWKNHLEGRLSLTDGFAHYLAAKSLFLREQQQFPGAGAGLYRFREFLSRATSLIEHNPRRASPRRLKARTGRLMSNAFDCEHVASVELRIAPRKSLSEWNKTFRIWQAAVADSTSRTRATAARFVVHFARSAGPGSGLAAYAAMRNVVERQTAVLHLFRHGPHEAARNIVGIDVAGAERDTPPEIFIPFFKLLRGHDETLGGDRVALDTWSRLKDRRLHTHSFQLPRLGQTFHAGEDFYHPITGLRQIELLARHLLEPGDRIGHGLVLGLNVSHWIAENKLHLRMPRGLVLDDLVWLRRVLPQVAPDRAKLSQDLDAQISRLATLVYEEDVAFQVLDALAVERARLPPARNSGTLSQRLHWREANDPRLHNIRQEMIADDAVAVLNQDAATVRLAQKHVTCLLAARGIVVEINPTSNLATGMIARLADHPAFAIIEDSNRQARISINTDDPGVFATRLDWEFGLMFEALQADQRYSRHDALELLEQMRATAHESAFE